MCLYPKLIRNKKYLPTKKNNYTPPTLEDERLKWVTCKCGECIECRKQTAREWQVRLAEESKQWKYKIFVTLSFSNESIIELQTKYNIEDTNTLATKATRLFLERYRKQYKKSIHHFFITELGHTNTERIHMHGIIFSNDVMTNELLEKFWKYGNTWAGWCNQRTINYIVKYITKIDEDHQDYKAKILASAGLGRTYAKSANAYKNKYNGTETIETYTLEDGRKINMPIYFRNKIYTEEEREQLWLQKIDKQEIYVMGIKCDISTEDGIREYLNLLKQKQKENKAMGYGNGKTNKKAYEITLKMLNGSSKI